MLERHDQCIARAKQASQLQLNVARRLVHVHVNGYPASVVPTALLIPRSVCERGFVVNCRCWQNALLKLLLLLLLLLLLQSVVVCSRHYLLHANTRTRAPPRLHDSQKKRPLHSACCWGAGGATEP